MVWPTLGSRTAEKQKRTLFWVFGRKFPRVCLPALAQGSSWVTAVTSSPASSAVAAPNRNGLLADAVAPVKSRSGCEVGSKRSKLVVGSASDA